MAGPKDIRAGGGFVELGVKDFLDAHLKRAGAKLRAFGSSVAGIGAAVSAAGTAALAPFAAAVTHFAAAGDAIDKAAARTGASAELLSELGFAAEQSGTSAQTLELGLKNLARTSFDLQQGLSTATDAFAEMGLTAADLEGLSPDEMLYRTAEALSQVEDASTRAALAQRVFGRSGTQLLPLLSQGAAGLEALRQEARDLGLTIGPEQAKAAAEVTDAYNRVKRSIAATVFQIGSALAPAVLTALDTIKQIAVAAGRWIAQNKQLVTIIAGVAAAVVAAGAALTAFGLTITVAGVALSGIATAIGLVLSPLGLLVGAAAAAGTALVRTGAAQPILDNMATQFAAIRDRVQEVGGAITNAFKAGDFDLLGNILSQGFTVAFSAARNKVVDLWEGIVATMQDIWFGLVESIAVAISDASERTMDLAREVRAFLAGGADLLDAQRTANRHRRFARRLLGQDAASIIRQDFDRQRQAREDAREGRREAREDRLAEAMERLQALVDEGTALGGGPAASPAVEAAVTAAEAATAATAAVDRTAELPQALQRGSIEAARQEQQNRRNDTERILDALERGRKATEDLRRSVEESGVVRVVGAG